MINAELTDLLEQLSLPVDQGKMETLKTYISLLEIGSKACRLVGDRDRFSLIFKHIFDSLYPLTVMTVKQGPLLDLGSGAGFPGVPLKIFLSDKPVYLLDSNRRKINFLKHVRTCLKLKHLYLLSGRAEELAFVPPYRESFQYVFSRAVAKIEQLVELALPFIVSGGQAVFYKGPAAQEELIEAKESLEKVGGRVSRTCLYRLPTGERRTLIFIDKVNENGFRGP